MARAREPMQYTPEPDPKLRQDFHDGQVEAMERIVTRYYHDVRRYALALMREEEKAHEAVQETFLRVVERHRLYQPARPFRPWLFAVCRNCCLLHLRQGRQRQARIVDLAPTGEEVERLAAETPPAWEAMIRKEREAQALSELGAMSEVHRTVIILHLFEDLTFREIGEITGMPAATAATLYYRTLTELRARLERRDQTLRGPCHAE